MKNIRILPDGKDKKVLDEIREILIYKMK